MDMTKAFDLVQHSILFQKLIIAGIPKIFIRILLFIYMFQFANVRWNVMFSDVLAFVRGRSSVEFCTVFMSMVCFKLSAEVDMAAG